MSEMLTVTQNVVVPDCSGVRGGLSVRIKLTDKYVLVGGFRRYVAMKEMLNADNWLDVLCDGSVVSIQFGQIRVPSNAEDLPEAK